METFYNYIYLDPRKTGNFNYGEFHFAYEPFYVGKGKGNRLYDHLKESMNRTHNKWKIAKIKKIKKQGLNPIIIKIYNDISEKTALQNEMNLIKIIGRKNKGPLVNLTDGGEGTTGYKHTKEDNEKNIKNLIKKVYQYDLNLNLIKEWNSISEASRFHNFKDSNIIKCCKKEINTAYNYVWSYKEIDNKGKNVIKRKIKENQNKRGKSTKVYQYDLNLNLIKEWNSIKRLLKYLKKHRVEITNYPKLIENNNFYYTYNLIKDETK